MGGKSQIKGSESCKPAALLFHSAETCVLTFCSASGADVAQERGSLAVELPTSVCFIH